MPIEFKILEWISVPQFLLLVLQYLVILFDVFSADLGVLFIGRVHLDLWLHRFTRYDEPTTFPVDKNYYPQNFGLLSSGFQLHH